MPITYHCDNCNVTADSLEGWKMVSIAFIRIDSAAPNPPGGRIQESVAPDLYFHDDACRASWCGKIGVTPPVAPTA